MSATGPLNFKTRKNEMSSGYFRIARNELRPGAKSNLVVTKSFGRLQPKQQINNQPEKKTIFAEDASPPKQKGSVEKNRKLGSKNLHYNQFMISDDSSEISFTEVKLA